MIDIRKVFSLSLRRLLPFLGIALFTVSIYVLVRELSRYTISDIAAKVGEIPASRFVIAAFLTFLTYLNLSFYDLIASRRTGSQTEICVDRSCFFHWIHFQQEYRVHVSFGHKRPLPGYTESGVLQEEDSRSNNPQLSDFLVWFLRPFGYPVHSMASRSSECRNGTL